MPGGRRSFITTDVLPSWERRLSPPACLGERERLAFVDLIASTPLGQFEASDLPLICRWCEASVMAERAAKELRDGGMVVHTKEGQKPSPWFTIHQAACKTLKDLALRLKLSPQSRHHKAPKSLPSGLSAYERLAMLDEGDDDEETQPS
jgi:phage terminase small subunit